ncbi:MAG: glycerol kinase GlpK [Clostridia bacterium]|nr:glycerol kinase GlpK [Clostridia bacterium]
MRYIVAIDEGTTSTRAVLYDLDKNKIVLQKSSLIKQIYPRPSFVEENANEIYAETLSSLVEILESADNIGDVLGIGITNQRETVIAWDKNTGKPLYNAIVWQCRRTAAYMRELAPHYENAIRQKTGLVMDAYFSASKIKWLIDNVPEIADKLKRNEVCFGTVDSFIVYKLTGGKRFVTDVTNASRTMLFNIHTLDYDDELLSVFGIPRSSLPEIVACDEQVGYFEYAGRKIAVCGIAGDQQAALVGQGCLSVGTSKITYGTGLFMLYNLGYKPIISQNGLITTVGYKIGGQTAYAFEGSVFNAGSAVQWLRDNLGFFKRSKDIEALAKTVEDNGGVYFVPAFTGLGAPYWNGNSRGMLCGLTRGSNKGHIARATLESMAYSARDLAEVMTSESGTDLAEIRCDGGASANDLLMQFQANVLGVDINRPAEKESTALGAVYLCAVGLGLADADKISELRETERVFVPDGDVQLYDNYYRQWQKAVRRCLYDE